MALSNALATLWSDRALIQLEKELIFASPLVCNRDYEGEVQDQGEAVNIVGVYDPIVGSYSQDTDLTIEALTDFKKTLTALQQGGQAPRLAEADAIEQLSKTQKTQHADNQRRFTAIERQLANGAPPVRM